MERKFLFVRMRTEGQFLGLGPTVLELQYLFETRQDVEEVEFGGLTDALDKP